MFVLQLFVASYLFLGTQSRFKTYEGYRVYALFPNTTEQSASASKIIDKLKLDQWFSSREDGEKHVLVPEKKSSDFLTEAEKRKIVIKLLFEVVDFLTAEKERLENRSDKKKKRFRKTMEHIQFDIDDFNTYDATMDQLDKLLVECKKKGLQCEIQVIGKTHENKDIKLFRMCRGVEQSTTPFPSHVTTEPSGTPTPSPTPTPTPIPSGTTTVPPTTTETPKQQDIWVDCLIHAREWITGPVCMKLIHKLIHEYDVNDIVTDLVDKYWWNVIPVLNPDGYQYSWWKDRFWRKNREPTFRKLCKGIDLNRNFDTKERCNVAEGMCSRNPCAEDYCGFNKNGPVSVAKEIKAVADKLTGEDLNILLLLNLHSYTQMWLAPYGYVQKTPQGKYACAISADNNLQEGLLQLAAGESAKAGGFKRKWRSGNSCKTIYPDSGTLTDFAYDTASIVHSYAVELRGKQSLVDNDAGRGFLIRKAEIQPAFDEFWAGMCKLIKEIEKLP